MVLQLRGNVIAQSVNLVSGLATIIHLALKLALSLLVLPQVFNNLTKYVRDSLILLTFIVLVVLLFTVLGGPVVGS